LTQPKFSWECPIDGTDLTELVYQNKVVVVDLMFEHGSPSGIRGGVPCPTCAILVDPRVKRELEKTGKRGE
jgi:hypothetical protein